jgi:hypothetical protein
MIKLPYFLTMKNIKGIGSSTLPNAPFGASGEVFVGGPYFFYEENETK